MLHGKEVWYLLLANGILTFLLMVTILRRICGLLSCEMCYQIMGKISLFLTVVSTHSSPAAPAFPIGLFFFSPHPLLAHVSYLDLLYFSSKGVAINRRTSSLESTSIGLNCVLRPLFALGSFQPVEIPFIFPHSIWLVMSDALSSLFQMSLRL